MAKIHQNAEKFPIQWNGKVVGGEQGGDSVPSDITLVWGSNDFTWGDAQFIQEIIDGIGTGSRRARQDRLNKILDDEDKKKRLIHLICRIKGEKVYDDYTEVGDVEIKVEDVEMVTENIIGKVKLEIKSGV
jgi:hypothetical protein